MNKMWLCCSAIIILSTACKQDARLFQLKALEQSILQNSNYMKDRAALAYRHIEDKWYNPRHRLRAELWLFKAKRVQYVCSKAVAYLDSLKYALTVNRKKPLVVLLPTGGISSVYNRLLSYKKELLAVLDTTEFKDNPLLCEYLRKDSRVVDLYMPLLPTDTTIITTAQKALAVQKWTHDHFGNSSSLSALLILDKLQSDVWMSQTWLIDYLNAQIALNWCGYTAYTGIVTISSQSLREGQSAKVYAGAGYMDFDNSPRFYVYDSAILADYDGWARHKFKVQGKPGKYTIPVRFEYEELGIIKSQTQYLEYIITQ